MIDQTKHLDVGLRIDSALSKRRQFAVKSLPIRISRGNQVIGKWSAAEIKERIGSEELLLTDTFYDEDASDWLPLSDLQTKQISVKVTEAVTRPCYCGSGLPFRVCCGDGSIY